MLFAQKILILEAETLIDSDLLRVLNIWLIKLSVLVKQREITGKTILDLLTLKTVRIVSRKVCRFLPYNEIRESYQTNRENESQDERDNFVFQRFTITFICT